ncbi:hypothetical protein FRB91_001244, partial [Serendipita sp. 411]
MSLGHSKISLHELTALQVDLNNRRTKAMPQPFKQASGTRTRTGNFVSSRPFKISRKRRMTPDDVDSSGEFLNRDEAQWEESEDRVPRKKRKKQHFPSDVLPFLHPPSPRRKATNRPINKDDELPSS